MFRWKHFQIYFHVIIIPSLLQRQKLHNKSSLQQTNLRKRNNYSSYYRQKKWKKAEGKINIRYVASFSFDLIHNHKNQYWKSSAELNRTFQLKIYQTFYNNEQNIDKVWIYRWLDVTGLTSCSFNRYIFSLHLLLSIKATRNLLYRRWGDPITSLLGYAMFYFCNWSVWKILWLHTSVFY